MRKSHKLLAVLSLLGIILVGGVGFLPRTALARER